MRSYTSRFLDECEGHAFALASRGNSKTIVHLKRNGRDWKLEGLFGPRNSRPSPHHRDWITRYLVSHGVLVDEPQPRKPSDWNSLSRLISEDLMGFDFGFELDDLEDES